MLKECDRVLNYRSNECGETVRYADLGLKSNQRSTEGNRTNMSTRGQTRPHAHERSAFDNSSHNSFLAAVIQSPGQPALWKYISL